LGRDEEGTGLQGQDRYDNLIPMQQRLAQRNRREDAVRLQAAQQRQGGGAPNNPNGNAAANGPQGPSGFGSFIRPEDPSWEAQAALVNNASNNLFFDPNNRLFDRIVAEKSGIRGLMDPSSPDFTKYAALRTNLAVIRNHLMANGTDPAKLASIAESLGQGFGNDVWVKRTFTNFLSADVANVEGVGAGEMYKYLLSIQQTPAPLEGIRQGIQKLVGETNRVWGLPPIEATPFSPAALGAASSPPNQASGQQGQQGQPGQQTGATPGQMGAQPGQPAAPTTPTLPPSNFAGRQPVRQNVTSAART
jgi:hypothetical protein